MAHLTWLARELRAEGLVVREYPGWQSRGASWTPDGGMQHHTAPPVPFPVDNLAGKNDGRVKCNLNVKPDGRVWVIAAGACNYSSGPGSGIVLAGTRRDVAPTGSARARGLYDTTGGNLHYFNIETDHPGDGSPLPAHAFDAMVGCWVVVCRKLGWPADRVIAHAEWSRRKIDPFWNAQFAHDAANTLRAAVEERLAGEIGDPVRAIRRGDQGRQVRIAQKLANNTPRAPEPPLVVDGVYGPRTEAWVLAWQQRRGIPNPDGVWDAFTRQDVTQQQLDPPVEEEPS